MTPDEIMAFVHTIKLIQVAFVLLAAGAAGGLLLTLLVALKVRFPALLGTGHGLTGLLGLALLYAAHLGGEAPAGPWWGLIVITLTMLGGLVLLRTIYRNNIPVLLALGHGGLGVFGLYLIYPLAFPA
jgi:hypothetical protein